MSVDCFVDTNVLVYAVDPSEPEKRAVALSWLEALRAERRLRISIQVLREYYVTVTAKLRPGMAPADAQADVRDLFAWEPISESAALFERAWRVQGRFSISFWDAMIVAAAQVGACGFLLSEDLQDGIDFEGLKVVNPFRHSLDAQL